MLICLNFDVNTQQSRLAVQKGTSHYLLCYMMLLIQLILVDQRGLATVVLVVLGTLLQGLRYQNKGNKILCYMVIFCDRSINFKFWRNTCIFIFRLNLVIIFHRFAGLCWSLWFHWKCFWPGYKRPCAEVEGNGSYKFWNCKLMNTLMKLIII